jgi:mRNA interferase RelE/StbE
LLAEKAGLWRYRVGAYRIVCRIEDDRLVVLVLAVGHRSKVYD